ncbi:MAG: hypothetical protein ACC707_04910 [Thiohalomonadales bacterium]
MASTKKTAIHFRSNKDGKATDAELTTSHYDDKDRVKRALQRLGLFLLLAVVTAFIPLAHFVLVPASLIAAFYLAYEAYKAKAINEFAEGECPTCGEQIKVKFEPKDLVPKWTYCPSCNESLHIDN